MSPEDQTRYFLSMVEGFWTEVSKEEFMAAERAADFHPKFPGEPATSGFSNGSSRGTTTYDGKDPGRGVVTLTLAQREEIRRND